MSSDMGSVPDKHIIRRTASFSYKSTCKIRATNAETSFRFRYDDFRIEAALFYDRIAGSGGGRLGDTAPPVRCSPAAFIGLIDYFFFIQ